MLIKRELKVEYASLFPVLPVCLLIITSDKTLILPDEIVWYLQITEYFS